MRLPLAPPPAQDSLFIMSIELYHISVGAKKRDGAVHDAVPPCARWLYLLYLWPTQAPIECVPEVAGQNASAAASTRWPRFSAAVLRAASRNSSFSWTAWEPTASSHAAMTVS